MRDEVWHIVWTKIAETVTLYGKQFLVDGLDGKIRLDLHLEERLKPSVVGVWQLAWRPWEIIGDPDPSTRNALVDSIAWSCSIEDGKVASRVNPTGRTGIAASTRQLIVANTKGTANGDVRSVGELDDIREPLFFSANRVELAAEGVPQGIGGTSVDVSQRTRVRRGAVTAGGHGRVCADPICDGNRDITKLDEVVVSRIKGRATVNWRIEQ